MQPKPSSEKGNLPASRPQVTVPAQLMQQKASREGQALLGSQTQPVKPARQPKPSHDRGTLAAGRPQVFTPEEVRRILQAATAERDRMFCKFLLYTGARISEALAVAWDDVHRNGGGRPVVILPTLKRRRPQFRTVPIPENFFSEWEAYRQACNLPRPFALSRSRAYLRIRSVLLAAGIEAQRAHPHTFRHTFATWAVQVGTPPAILQRLLGHATLNLIQVYYNYTAEDARNWVERIALLGSQ